MNYYAVMLKKKKVYVIFMHGEDSLTPASSKERAASSTECAASSKERSAYSLKRYHLLQNFKFFYTRMTPRGFT
jgi:hypothetical protein